MNEREMIKKLKKNLAEFDYCLANEQAVFKKAGPENCWRLACGGAWIPTSNFESEGIYHIKPDYQPEPEIEECEVGLSDAQYPVLGYYRQRDPELFYALEEALSDPDYLRPVNKSGRTVGLRGWFGDGNKPADWPDRLLFRRSK